MSDILIREVPMPVPDFHTTITIMGNGDVLWFNEKVRTAIPLPEGHGRGIDADAVIATYTPDSYELNKMHMTQESYDKLPTVAAIKRAISNALTLIPTERGTDDG